MNLKGINYDVGTSFMKGKICGAFVFTFINPSHPSSHDPVHDLDLASYGIVKPVPKESHEFYKDLPWVPKKAFYSLGDIYGSGIGNI